MVTTNNTKYLRKYCTNNNYFQLLRIKILVNLIEVMNFLASKMWFIHSIRYFCMILLMTYRKINLHID